MQLQLKLNPFCFLSVNSIMQHTGCTISSSSINVVNESINGITMITNLSQTEELFPKYTLVQSMRELINGMLKNIKNDNCIHEECNCVRELTE